MPSLLMPNAVHLHCERVLNNVLIQIHHGGVLVPHLGQLGCHLRLNVEDRNVHLSLNNTAEMYEIPPLFFSS